mmetsp:Transcript_3691/g.5710  ORF Transcript_3691/g.5710 Transcript_3691/m.5710 type:complete len:343 (-) Transcript_3691:111-1139(-)
MIELDLGDDTANSYWNRDISMIQNTARNVYCPQLISIGKILNENDCEALITSVSNVLVLNKDWVKDGYGYFKTVIEAVADDKSFDVFKSDIEYKSIVETVSPEIGVEYFHKAATQSPDWIQNDTFLYRLQENDLFGSPMSISEVDVTPTSQIRMSATTLRYLSVGSDLQTALRVFDSPSLSVAEIGIGYGGQAQVLAALADLYGVRLHYTFFDLDIVRQLAHKYLSKFSWIDMSQFHFHADSNVGLNRVTNLCISNYAISEFSKSVQDQYIDSVMKYCENGYVMFNNIGVANHGEGNSYTVQEFIDRVRATSGLGADQIVVLPEYPLTHPENILVLWSSNRF